MIGKGLESLIPPQKGNAGQQPAPQTQPARPMDEPSRLPMVQPASEQPRQEIKPQPQPQPEPARAVQQPKPEPMSAQPYKPQQAPTSESVFHIELDKIKPNPDQPRRNFNEELIRELANSIREFGILQPLVVTKVEKETSTGIGVEYQLIAGERRYLAAKMLGLSTVPAMVRNVHLEREKLELAVIENIQRENLNPIETARAFQRLQEEFRMTQREIAAKLGKSREVVANAMRLLDLPEYIRVAVEKGELSESHARLLLTIAEPGVQKKLFDDIITNRLTTRDVKERVEQLGPGVGTGRRRGRPPLTEENVPPEVKAMQETLSASLGAPVEIKKGGNTGKITIMFYSEEELENIMQKLRQERGREDF